ncbi:MAG: glycosyltransferase family 39 protein [Chloroflexota bacterium]|nr:glycosyltransferase family 39 protein [Chloroflexota bacterium]
MLDDHGRAHVVRAAEDACNSYTTRGATRSFVETGALFVGALVARGVAQILVRPDPTKIFMFDPTLYYLLADSIAHDAAFAVQGVSTAAVTPAYPALLSVPFFLFGSHLELALATNALLGAATAVLTYLFANSLFGRPSGILAGLVVMILPSYALLSTVLLAENLAAPLIILALLLSLRVIAGPTSAATGAALGAVMALGVLTRGEFSTVVLALLITLAAHRERGRQRTARWLVPAAAVFFVIVGLWIVRNQEVIGAPVLATNTVSGGLYNSLGPHPGSFPPNFFDDSVPADQREADASRRELRAALDFARDHPLEETRRIPKRFWTFVRNDEGAFKWITPDPHAVSASAANRLRVVCNVFYVPLILLAILGLPCWFARQEPRHLLVVATIAGWTASHVFLFPGDAHYHIVLVPILAVMAANAGIVMERKLRARAT